MPKAASASRSPRSIVVNRIGIHVWACRRGSALTSAWISRMPSALVLNKPGPRAVKVEGPDGQPIASAHIYSADRRLTPGAARTYLKRWLFH